MRMAESRGAHFKGLLLLFAIPVIPIFAVKKYKFNNPFQLNNYKMTPKSLLVLSKFSTPKKEIGPISWRGQPGWQVTLQLVLAALAVIPVSLAMFAGKRLYLYLGVATRMTGYPATGACSPGDDSSVSCRILGNSQVETHTRISHKRLCSIMASREYLTRILVGQPNTALNSKPVSAAMTSSLFSFALFKYSKFEPSITHYMVFGVESSQVEKPITGLSLKSEALERWGTRSFKGFLCPSTLFFSSFFNASAGALDVAGGTDAGMLPDFLLVFAAMALLDSLVARAYQRSEPHFLHRFS
ncbi:hypothetical protein MTR67_029710 [Solanum verrucosum]|uniref:Uncharacterized protein n=1 Tax=Solanum verrucosum TaxID=315347 RepID=A0AAF0U0F5_SOLVR|nr:hypothetical protein MTR67_029710 [Solanum verrucosum]